MAFFGYSLDIFNSFHVFRKLEGVNPLLNGRYFDRAYLEWVFFANFKRQKFCLAEKNVNL